MKKYHDNYKSVFLSIIYKNNTNILINNDGYDVRKCDIWNKIANMIAHI